MKDRVDKGEIDVKYCMTHLMIADYFTKPLQGKMFKLFRDVIMGYAHVDSILNSDIPQIKERVGKYLNLDENVRRDLPENVIREKSEKETMTKRKDEVKKVTYADVVSGQ